MPARLERLLRMEHEIRRGSYPSIQTFCAMFDVQPRTVFEDIRMLRQEAGLEIAFDRLRKGYFNANPDKRLLSLDLMDDELLALSLSKELLSKYTGGIFESVLQGALDKIVERSKRKTPLKLIDTKSLIRFKDIEAMPPTRKVFVDLLIACSQGSVVCITESDGDAQKQQISTVEPRCLVANKGSWHLVANCRQTNALRNIPVHKIHDVKVLAQVCSPADATALDAFVDKAFVTG